MLVLELILSYKYISGTIQYFVAINHTDIFIKFIIIILHTPGVAKLWLASRMQLFRSLTVALLTLDVVVHNVVV